MQQLLDDIAIKVKFLYRESVDSLADKFAFEKRPDEGEIQGAPTVLILGNHSSGKSTFINHLLGAPIQKTGLAPTDDAFTVLSFGSNAQSANGNLSRAVLTIASTAPVVARSPRADRP